MSLFSDEKPALRNEPPAEDVEEVRGSLNDLDADSLELRRGALKSMLESSLARYDIIMSRKLPNLAPGVRVTILKGPLMNTVAVVKEADYISERALVTPAEGVAQWIRFSALGPA